MTPEENPLHLTISQQFEIEKMWRAIDSCSDVKTLQTLAKDLAKSWVVQRAMVGSILKSTPPKAPIIE